MKKKMKIILPMILISSAMYIMFSMKKNMKKKKNNSPFECGFNKMKKMKNHMSINFITFMFSFLIIELEICILIPLIKTKKSISNFQSSFMMILILSILTTLEWNKNSLKWNK